MLARGVRVEGCARCAHGMTGKRSSLPKFFEKPEEKLPAFHDNFRNLLSELRHWHVPSLVNGALSHTLFWLHLNNSLHSLFLNPLHNLNLWTSPIRSLLASPSYNDQHLMDLAAKGV